MPGRGSGNAVYVALVVVVGLLLTASACVPVAPAPAQDNPAQNSDPRPTKVPPPSPTPYLPLLIDDVVLATEVGDDGAPVDGRTGLPANAPVAYLSVLARDLQTGTTLEAEWVRDGEVIGHSTHSISEDVVGDQWIALVLEPPGGFPAGDYAVRLFVDGRMIESLVFKSGAGRAVADTREPRLVFTTSWSASQASVSTLSTFPGDTRRVIAVLVDAPPVYGRNFVAHWYLGAQLLSEIVADQTQSLNVRTFTLESSEPLSPGRYRVQVFSGNQTIASSSFVVEAPQGADTDAKVERIVVTTQIDANTRQPLGETVTTVSPPITLYGMVLARDVGPGDVLEIVWIRNDQVVTSSRLAGRDVPNNWVSSRYELPAEPEGSTAQYRVVARINGVTAAQHAFVATGPVPPTPPPAPPPPPAPAPTPEPEPTPEPTPEPSEPDPGEDDDSED
jgi:hypothetical protein